MGDTFFVPLMTARRRLIISLSLSTLIKIAIAGMHYLKTSDHTHLELSLKLSSPISCPETLTQDQAIYSKIRWDKCDIKRLYRSL